MTTTLSTGRATALYIGALLGPGLLFLPGLAAHLAGPASVLAWAGLLGLSALFAIVFTALGVRVGGRGGVAGYVTAGLGVTAGRAIGWCFVVGVALGAPVVCLVGAGYLADVLGVGGSATIGLAAALLALVVVVTALGARAVTSVQLGLVVALVVVIAVAVTGAGGHARAANWTPFAPHGWAALGRTSSALMLSFVGWEAIAPMTDRLADAKRQLPRVIAAAFAVTAVVYLGLSVTTVATLGPRGDGQVALARLLALAIGPAGRILAAVVAVAVTLAAVNAYVSGATELARSLAARPQRHRHGLGVQLAVAVVGVLVLALVRAGAVSTTTLVLVPTALFLTVYLGCMAAAARVLHGGARRCAAVALPVVAVVLGFGGWALLAPVAVIMTVLAVSKHGIRRHSVEHSRNPLLMPDEDVGSVNNGPGRVECEAGR